MELTTLHDEVREYYGRTLASNDDLHTDAPHCEAVPPPRYVTEVMPLIADEIIARFYGCGSPIPPALEGCTVLDLGSGSGREAGDLRDLGDGDAGVGAGAHEQGEPRAGGEAWRGACAGW